MNTFIEINSNIKIPLSEIQLQFSRSGGHGGQNVNKLSTRVELFFDIPNSQNINEETKIIFLQKLKERIDTHGILRITSQETRSQWKNREIALEKFAELLRKTLIVRKKRIATKVSKQAKQKRIEEKKKRGEVKKMRREKINDE